MVRPKKICIICKRRQDVKICRRCLNFYLAEIFGKIKNAETYFKEFNSMSEQERKAFYRVIIGTLVYARTLTEEIARSDFVLKAIYL